MLSRTKHRQYTVDIRKYLLQHREISSITDTFGYGTVSGVLIADSLHSFLMQQ
jgi:hypothetical protein